MALIDQIQQAYDPFVTGPLGQDPATQAYMQAFTQNTLPLIQNQMQLQGLGSGPAVADVAGRALGTALPQIQQYGAQNRLAAAGGLTGLGSQLVLPSWQQQMAQQGQALNALTGAGQTIQGMEQNPFDAQQAEAMRLQGLAESGTFGAFGSMSPTVRTESGGGK
jgi:hypothetical protein